MIKQNKPDDSVMAVSCVDKIKARLARDEKRLKHKREVYMYRRGDIYYDNLLMLDSSCAEVHAEVFKSWYESLTKNVTDKERYLGIEVVHIGTFDKLRFIFSPSKKHKVIFKG